MTLILASLEAIMEDKFATDQPEQINFLRLALEGAHNLHGLLEDVLMLASLDQGKGKPFRRHPIDLKYHFTEPVHQKVRQQYGDKNLQLLLKVEEALHFSAPLPEFVQAIRHLVDNACKFSPPNGRIGLKLAANGAGGAILTIFNEAGPVIPPELREKVFERYYQVGQGQSRPYNGLGVGLTLARAIARSIGGDVLILNTDHGCMVQMTIPPSRVNPNS
jgi:signal transduction histidine kinase